ncbi:MAG TPA: nickel pincer cofactor biosynthesis protein LarC [Verrucomicrobiota bacterium]|nr:nickel pincer cofactor biosynthesis protein LarC [Verrucomicrobiota bacterium]
MKILYLDIFSGIAGDMFIAALIDLGVDARRLERELAKLKLDGYHLHVSKQERQGIAGAKFDVHVSHDHAHGGHATRKTQNDHYPEPAHAHCHGESACGAMHLHEHSHHDHDHSHDDSRNFSDIKKLITRSKLSAWVKRKSVAVFQRIAEAEGKIHGKPASEVHFHEVGAVDSIVDIVGACIALEMLGKPRVLASPVIEGTGWVKCAHGRFPVPAPATLAILGARGIGITQCDEPHELVTPTGAALLAEFVEDFKPMTGLIAEKIGFGLGTRENKTRPNVLRAVLGKTAKKTFNIQHPTSNFQDHDWETDRIAVLETNLDDINAEILGQFVEASLAAGALDVFHTPIQMKKNRPGVMLTVLCAETDADKFSEMILRNTTAFGVRRTIAERRKLRREFKSIKTKFGNVTVKIGRLDGEVVQVAPEFESCRKLAAQKKVPLKHIYEAAVKAAKL